MQRSFLGSGLLLLAMLFAAAAVFGAIIIAFHAVPEQLGRSATFHFARGLASGMINIYLVKTAAVFMSTTLDAALACRRRIPHRGRAFVWQLYLDWSLLVFPLWVLMISLSILWDEEATPSSS